MSFRTLLLGICFVLGLTVQGQCIQSTLEENPTHSIWGKSPFLGVNANSSQNKTSVRKVEPIKKEVVKANIVSTPKPAENRVQEIPVLSAIWRGEGGYRAMVSQTIVKAGDRVGGYSVVKVGIDEVVLKGESGSLMVLSMRSK